MDLPPLTRQDTTLQGATLEHQDPKLEDAATNVDIANSPDEDKPIIEEWIKELRETSTEIKRNWYDKDNNLNNNFKNHIRGRILFILAESNLKEKTKNIGKSVIGYNKSDAAKQRGAKYKEALNQILSLSDEGLGNYSVLANTHVGQLTKSAISGTRKLFGLGGGGKNKKRRRTQNKRRK